MSTSHRAATQEKYKPHSTGEVVDIEPPRELPDRLHDKWVELALQLKQARTLEVIDLPLVTRLVYYRDQWMNADLDDAVKLEGLIIRLEKQLGATPAARKHVSRTERTKVVSDDGRKNRYAI